MNNKYNCRSCKGTWDNKPIGYCPYCESYDISVTLNVPDNSEVGLSGLLDCPFCGGEAGIGTIGISGEVAKLNERDKGFFVNCILCGSNNNGLHIGFATEIEATGHWNTRSS